MKRVVTAVLLMIFTLGIVGCNQSTKQNEPVESLTVNQSDTSKESDSMITDNTSTSSTEEAASQKPAAQKPTAPESEKANILVAYFSATGTTRPLAEYAADILNADLYEIVPEQPYSDDDLAYYTGGRADTEQNDPASRPAISGSADNMEQYDVILLGYPIWHGQAPKIIYTFLESYDFSGKTILPFCTSHSSGIGSSADNLHDLTSGANWLDGRRFAPGASKEEIENWLNENGISPAQDTEVGAFDFEKKTVLLNSGYEMPIIGLGTYSL